MVSVAYEVDRQIDQQLSSNFAPEQKKYLRPDLDIKYKLAFWKKCGYEPTPAQLQAHMSKAKFVTLVCAARFGKSLWAGAEIAVCIALIPDFRCWAVATQYSLALNEFNWACDLLGAYQIPGSSKTLLELATISRATKGQNKVQFKWGSFCETKSADHEQGMFGASLDMIVLGEATHMKEDDVSRILIPRLGDRLGRMLIPSTASDAGGLLRDYYDMGQDEDEKFCDYDSFQFSIYDNPYFDTEEVERAKNSLSYEIFAEQYLGKFVSRLGRVFKFREELHVFTDYSKKIHEMPCIVGMRYKDNNPICAALIKVDAKNQIYYVIDEFYEKHASVQQVCDWVIEKGKKHVIRTIVTEQRDKGIIGEIKRCGINVKVNQQEEKYSAKQAYSKRVRLLQELLEVCELRGVPRLFIYDKCENAINDFDKATWPKIREGKEQSELPLDENMFLPRTISLAVAKGEFIFSRDVYK